MEVWRLPLASSLRGKLISAGYTSLSSLSSISPSDFARDLNITETEALDILKVALQSAGTGCSGGTHASINGAQSAWDMLHEEQSLPLITTSCTKLDNILGGGISFGEVTEIGGLPGIGKTQLGIQLSVNVQIPVEFGGLGGKAIYIDTEGSFMVERVLQVAEACVEDLSEYNEYMHRNSRPCQVRMEPRHILENIYYFRACSYTEQIALVNHLDKFISEHKDVKVVIVDSVTFHFRQDFDDMAQRTRVLSEMALKFMKLAKKFSLAVVLLNQVTTKFIEGSFQLALALGDSWSHSCTNRVILYWKGDERYAYIDKSPTLPSSSAPFSVTSRGVRNPVSDGKRIRMT